VLELEIPEELPPTPFGELRVPESAIVGTVVRGKRVIVPKGKDTLQGKDRVLVFCTVDHAEEVRDFFLRGVLRPVRAT
jgi:Trk K+ transport system NAD-binding subunit